MDSPQPLDPERGLEPPAKGTEAPHVPDAQASRRDLLLTAAAVVASATYTVNNGPAAPAEIDDITEPTDSPEYLAKKVRLFEVMFTEEGNKAFFYTPTGELLEVLDTPKDWGTYSAAQKTEWYTSHQAKLKRPNEPVFYDSNELSFKTLQGKSPVELANQRSEEETHDERYFGGEVKTVKAAIWEICEAYEMPVEIAMGFAANQSLFQKDEIDRLEDGRAGGRGLFKITSPAYEDALRWISAHPEASQKIRSQKLGDFDKEWKNRFVQIEIFAAYYRQLKDRITAGNAGLNALEARLNNIDPSFSADVLEEAAVVSAYYAGYNRIRQVIEKFIGASDAEIQSFIGSAPYGVNIWEQILLTSYNEGGIDQKSIDFTSKIYAMSSLMGEEGATYVEDALGESHWLQKIVSLVSGLGALSAGAYVAGDKVKKARSGAALSRREALMGGVAGLAALAVPAQSLPEIDLPDLPKFSEAPTEPIKEDSNVETPLFPEVLALAKKALDEKYKELRKEKRITRTNTEKNEARKYTQPSQDTLLRPTFNKILGKELTDKILSTKGKSQKKRNDLYDQASKKVREYRDQQVKNGTFVHLQEDNGHTYFCQQVGMESGTQNNPDSMYAHKDLLPLMGTMVQLINHQIDLFNANPSDYGVKSFPKIPHVAAVKLSGALRDPKHTKRMLNGAQARFTTKSLSAHWSGQALDIGAYTTPNAHMVRFVEAMLDEKGDEVIPAGGLLPTGGFGNRTREFLSTFIGRALFAMEKPLADKEGMEIMALWEPTPKNWHVATRPKAA